MKAEKNYCSGYWFFSAGDKIVVLNDSFCDENQKHYDIDGSGIAHRKDKELTPLDENEMKRIKRLITNPIGNVSFPPWFDEGKGYALYKNTKDTKDNWFLVYVKKAELGIKMEHKDIARVSQVGVVELKFKDIEKNSLY